MNLKRPKILWMDCIGALIAGTLVLAISSWLSVWEGLPHGVLIFMGMANLIYGIYSLNVTMRTGRTSVLVGVLAFANMAWLIVCGVIVAMWWNEISLLGLIHVLGEGCYVAALGFTEWRLREKLVTAPY